MNDRRQMNDSTSWFGTKIVEELRQFWYPAEFRIAAPCYPEDWASEAVVDQTTPVRAQTAPETPSLIKMTAELATFLWYLKTKHFKRDWEDDESGDDDPRVRRLLGRLNRAIDSLKAGGIEVMDPTNKRYPTGGENMMRPIQLQPTVGLTVETVTETIVPIVFYGEQLIQRAEVFVAVPQQEPSSPTGTKVAPDQSSLAHQVGTQTESDESAQSTAPASVSSNGENTDASSAGSARDAPATGAMAIHVSPEQQPCGTGNTSSEPAPEPCKSDPTE